MPGTATQRQEAVIGYLREFILARGYPPTRREIMDHFGWRSTNAAQQHLRLLRQKGLLEWDERTARGIRLCQQQS